MRGLDAEVGCQSGGREEGEEERGDDGGCPAAPGGVEWFVVGEAAVGVVAAAEGGGDGRGCWWCGREGMAALLFW